MGNFHSLQVVDRSSGTQLEVGKNLNELIYWEMVYAMLFLLTFSGGGVGDYRSHSDVSDQTS